MLFIVFFSFFALDIFYVICIYRYIKKHAGKRRYSFTLSINTKTSRALRNNNNNHLYSDVFQAYV